MEDILLKLEEWSENMNFDLNQDWCENKTHQMFQLFKIQQAKDLLKSIGKNQNIPE